MLCLTFSGLAFAGISQPSGADKADLSDETDPPAELSLVEDIESFSSWHQENGIVHPPMPIYPQMALHCGLGGRCTANLNLTLEGIPTDIVMHCSHPVFCESAVKAARATRFDKDQIQSGQLQDTNIYFPIVYLMEDMREQDIMLFPLKRCIARNVS